MSSNSSASKARQRKVGNSLRRTPLGYGQEGSDPDQCSVMLYHVAYPSKQHLAAAAAPAPGHTHCLKPHGQSFAAVTSYSMQCNKILSNETRPSATIREHNRAAKQWPETNIKTNRGGDGTDGHTKKARKFCVLQANWSILRDCASWLLVPGSDCLQEIALESRG